MLARFAILLLLCLLATSAAYGEGDDEALRAELLWAVPRPEVQPARGGPESSLALVTSRVRVVTDRGIAAVGVTVRALHRKFDISEGPAVTNDQGEVTLSLPRGPWRVDVSRSDGPAVFGQTQVDVTEAGTHVVALSPPRTIRFKHRRGLESQPSAATLATTNRSLIVPLSIRRDRFSLAMAGSLPIHVQAVGAGGSMAGYVHRSVVLPEQTEVIVDPEDATEHVFAGRADRKLSVSYRSTDALPLVFEFQGAKQTSVLVSGLDRIALSLGVESGEHLHAFYSRPFDVDGEKRTFTGGPPFAASVGYVVNDSKIFGKARGSLGIRVFLTEENGLLLQGNSRGASYRVEWEELLGESVRASGTMRNWYLEQTPAIDRKELPALRYRLRVKGRGMDERFDVVPHPQSKKVVAGSVHMRAHPELAPNVRLWAAAVDAAFRSFEEGTMVHRSRVDVTLFSRMPSGTPGFGGYRGKRGFMYLPESRVFGFDGCFEWTKRLGYELGHVQGLGRGQSMGQAGTRAGRRHHANRIGPERIPMGNRFRAFLEAVTSGEDLASPDHDLTGEDGILAWMIRCHGGGKAVQQWRRHRPTWRWALVRRGHTDTEIEAAVAAHVGGPELVEIARLRGPGGTRDRIDAARKILQVAGESGSFDWSADRTRARAKWARMDWTAVEDLAAAAAEMRSELGSRRARIAVLLALAEEWGRRGRVETMKTGLFAAMQEASLGRLALFDETVTEAVAILRSR